MSKSEYATEDFVLDPDFRKWVLENNTESKAYWVDFLSQNPHKVNDIYQAREILINLSREKKALSDQKVQFLFSKISQRIDREDKSAQKSSSKVVEMDSWSTIQKYNLEQEKKSKKRLLLQWAASLILFLGLGSLFYLLNVPETDSIQETAVEWITFEAPAGVKSSISLEDGSKIHLNSGSKITYPQNFPNGIRAIELVGEAFFEVAKDSLRPFKVSSGHLTTTALGTSFNIKAYPNQVVSVSLLTGKVKVEGENKEAYLIPGEAIRADLTTHFWKQGTFDREEILAWMNKTLVFTNTPFLEAVLQMENWFGVQIEIQGDWPKDLKVSGKFKDETLQNILEGLSFSTHFTYKIQGKQVQINFKP